MVVVIVLPIRAAPGALSNRPEHPAIRTGDTVVTVDAAPLKAGRQTLLTIDVGMELVVAQVQGKWLAVTVQQGGEEVSGWVQSEHVQLVGKAVEVPSLVGMTAEAAKQAAAAAGLVAKFELGKPAASTAEIWRVYATRPEGGVSVGQGATVHVTVYADPAVAAGDSPSPAAADTTPRLLGLSAVKVKETLDTAGLRAEFRLGDPAPSPEQEHTAYRQTPTAGTARSAGGVVEVLLYDAFAPSAGEATRPQIELTAAVFSLVPAAHEPNVQPRSGRLRLTVQDLAIPAGSSELTLRRSYRARNRWPGLLGAAWWLEWEKLVIDLDGAPAVVEADRVVLFDLEVGRDRHRSATGDELTFDDRRAVRLLPDGGREMYDRSGRLVQVVRPGGSTIRLDYAADGRLSDIRGPFGAAVHLTADAQGRLTHVRGSTGATVQYFYGEDPGADTGSSFVVRYAYESSGRLAEIKHPQTGTTRLLYDGEGRVVVRCWADGAEERYEYAPAENTFRQVDPLGRTTVASWTDDGHRLSIVNPLGHKTLFRYDDAGRMVASQGPTGETAQIDYDSLGRVEQVASSTAGQFRFEYEGESRLPSAMAGTPGTRAEFHRDGARNVRTTAAMAGVPDDVQLEYGADGLVTRAVIGAERHTLAYDDRGLLQTMTDAAGNVTRLEHDSQGNLFRVIDAMGNVFTQSRDLRGLLTAGSDATGATSRFEYLPSGLLAREIGPLGDVTAYEYDSRGRVVAETDPLERITRYEYAQDGTLTTIADPAGHVTKLEWDAVGRRIGETNPLGGTIIAVYDPQGRLLEQTDSAGGVARFAYNTAGQLVELTDAAGTVSRFEYDDCGRLVSETDAVGQTTRYQYDDEGRLAKRVPARGPAIQIEYDDGGNVAVVREGQRELAQYEYDELGRPVRERVATGLETSYEYDAVGNLVAWNDTAGGSGKARYDALRRVVALEDASGATARVEYDPAGNPEAVADPLDNVRRRQYNLAGELVGVVEPNGDRVTYAYDKAGNLVEVGHPGGGKSAYVCDALGNPVEIVDPLGNKTLAKYDPAGRLVRFTDAKGQTTEYAYDVAGRMTEKRLADGTVVRYCYDERGNLLEADDGEFPVRYQYDAADNVTLIEYPVLKRKLQYRYDDRDRLVEFIDSRGHSITYGYDEHGRLTEMLVDGGRPIRFDYDVQDRRTEVVYPNGIRGEWKYDASDRAVGLTYAGPDGQTIAGWTYRYDAAGNCVQVTDAEGSATRYRYDPSGQLLEEAPGDAERIVYSYLPGGNRAKRVVGDETTQYRYDEADRLLQAGEETFTYDANGNLVERRTPDRITRYSYDTEDRLVKVDLPGGAEVSYGYAPTGERIWRRDAQGKTWFVTDGLEVVAELDEKLDDKAGYVHGPDIDEPLIMMRDGETCFLHPDVQGSIRRLTTEVGKVTASADYDAFGGIRSQTQTFPCRFMYTGREHDPATGLYYYRARYYAPDLGRFLTTDPADVALTDVVDLNPYVYAWNNPVRFRDPLGLKPPRVNLVNNRFEAPVRLPAGLKPHAELFHYGPRSAISSIMSQRQIRFGTSPATRGEVHLTTFAPGRGPAGGIGSPRGTSASVAVRTGDLARRGYVIKPNTNPNLPRGTAWIIRKQAWQKAVDLPPSARQSGPYRGARPSRPLGGGRGGAGRKGSVLLSSGEGPLHLAGRAEGAVGCLLFAGNMVAAVKEVDKGEKNASDVAIEASGTLLFVYATGKAAAGLIVLLPTAGPYIVVGAGAVGLYYGYDYTVNRLGEAFADKPTAVPGPRLPLPRLLAALEARRKRLLAAKQAQRRAEAEAVERSMGPYVHPGNLGSQGPAGRTGAMPEPTPKAPPGGPATPVPFPGSNVDETALKRDREAVEAMYRARAEALDRKLTEKEKKEYEVRVRERAKELDKKLTQAERERRLAFQRYQRQQTARAWAEYQRRQQIYNSYLQLQRTLSGLMKGSQSKGSGHGFSIQYNK